MKKHLYCRSIYIGEVSDVLEHQGTYFGTIRLNDEPVSGTTEERIRHFINQLIDFNDKLEQAENNVADDSFLNAYDDLINETEWRIEDRREQIILESAPNFI